MISLIEDRVVPMLDANAALKDTIFADDEPFDAEAFVEEVCG